MAHERFAGGAVYISDESDFYGDDETVAKWEKKARRKLKLPEPTLRRANVPVAKKRKAEAPEQQHHVKDHTAAASPRRKEEDHVLGLLGSRPQVAKLQSDSMQDHKPTTKSRTRAAAGEEASDLVHRDHFKGRADAWQQDETIDDFLKRLPVANPDTASVGPWLWVSSPQDSRGHLEQRKKANPDAFMELGDSLLHDFLQQRSKIEDENSGKAPATITRKMGPHRDQLEEGLLSAAVKTGTTCGKWMLFPGSDDLPRYWRLVAEATSEGKLGPVAKVATPDPYSGKDETLICVYTYDFTDIADVRRVLDELLELNLCRRDGRAIYYKCDAYTYMNITSNNDYKLRASLFSSAELFKDADKPLKEGPIARLKKHNQKIDSFLSS